MKLPFKVSIFTEITFTVTIWAVRHITFVLHYKISVERGVSLVTVNELSQNRAKPENLGKFIPLTMLLPFEIGKVIPKSLILSVMHARQLQSTLNISNTGISKNPQRIEIEHFISTSFISNY